MGLRSAWSAADQAVGSPQHAPLFDSHTTHVDVSTPAAATRSKPAVDETPSPGSMATTSAELEEHDEERAREVRGTNPCPACAASHNTRAAEKAGVS